MTMRLLTLCCVLLASPAMAEEARPKVVMLDLQSDAALKEQANLISELILTELSRSGRVDAVGSSDVRALIGLERQKELLGCGEESASCLAELSGALGARYVLTGAVGRVGQRVRFDLKVIDTSTSRPIAREGETVSEDALPEAVKRAVVSLEGRIPGAAPARVQVQAGPPVRWLPLGLIAGGVASGVGGVALMAMGNGFNSRDLSALTFDQASALRSTAQGQLYGGYALTGVGIVAVGAGVALFVLAPEAPAQAIALPVPGGWAFTAAGRF